MSITDSKKRGKRIELYKDKRGGFRFRVKGGNGEVIGVSESYTRKFTAKKAALRDHPDAVVVDLTVTKGKK